MLKLPSLLELDQAHGVRLYVCTRATDMRKGFDTLAQLARQTHQQEVFSGSLFIFLSRGKDRIKILYWDRDGLALWYKRLEEGTFRLPATEPSGGGIQMRASPRKRIVCSSPRSWNPPLRTASTLFFPNSVYSHA